MIHKILLVTSLLLSQLAGAQNSQTSQLIGELGIRESDVASRQMLGWYRPEKITIVSFQPTPDNGTGSVAWYEEVLDGVELEIINPGDDDFSFDALKTSDVYVGWCSADAVAAGEQLRYMHIFSAGIDRCMQIPGLSQSGLIVTNSAKAASQTIAEHSIALMLMLTRNLNHYFVAQQNADWGGTLPDTPPPISVVGKTMLVLGLGGIGTQVAMRGHSLGMRIIGTRNSSRRGPDYVDYVGLSNEMVEMAREADVVVNALPLTQATTGLVNAEFFAAMPDDSYYITVGRGGTTDTDALVSALSSGHLSGAGLDVTDPEPLPVNHALWSMNNVVITPHDAAISDLSLQNTLIIARENLRRYVHGEKLLNLTDLHRGY